MASKKFEVGSEIPQSMQEVLLGGQGVETFSNGRISIQVHEPE